MAADVWGKIKRKMYTRHLCHRLPSPKLGGLKPQCAAGWAEALHGAETAACIPGGLVSAGLGEGLRICFSNIFPGDAVAATASAPWTPFENQTWGCLRLWTEPGLRLGWQAISSLIELRFLCIDLEIFQFINQVTLRSMPTCFGARATNGPSASIEVPAC